MKKASLIDWLALLRRQDLISCLFPFKTPLFIGFFQVAFR